MQDRAKGARCEAQHRLAVADALEEGKDLRGGSVAGRKAFDEHAGGEQQPLQHEPEEHEAPRRDGPAGGAVAFRPA